MFDYDLGLEEAAVLEELQSRARDPQRRGVCSHACSCLSVLKGGLCGLRLYSVSPLPRKIRSEIGPTRPSSSFTISGTSDCDNQPPWWFETVDSWFVYWVRGRGLGSGTSTRFFFFPYRLPSAEFSSSVVPVSYARRHNFWTIRATTGGSIAEIHEGSGFPDGASGGG